MKKSLNKVFAIAALAASSAALAAETSPHSVTGNVGFISDYTFRGISQNYRQPAVQGGFDYAHADGLYAGTWASNISGNQYTNASMEWDVYGGYNGKVNDDVSYGLGLNYAMYPGGKTATTQPTKKWDTAELNVGATVKGFNLKYTYALTDWYGISSANGGGFEPTLWATGDTQATGATGRTTADVVGGNQSSKGSGYIEANYNYGFAGDHTLLLHVGHQKIRNFHLLSYTDYKIGVTKPLGGFTLGVAYTRTNATDNSLYHVLANGDNRNLRGGIFALSANRSF
jgi:uncharacterized protein (TIGR02001 family)